MLTANTNPAAQAKEYILDPLTTPEPSQECGPGTSFSISQNKSESDHPLQNWSANHSSRQSKQLKKPKEKGTTRTRYPEPLFLPLSLQRLTLEDKNSYIGSRYSNKPARRPRTSSHTGFTRSDRSVDNRNKISTILPPDKPNQEQSQNNIVQYPPHTSVTRVYSASADLNHLTGSLLQDHSPSSPMATTAASLGRSNSVNTGTSVCSGKPRRSSSLSQRYPGDMSHRPLDMLRQEARSADKARHLRSASATRGQATDAFSSVAHHHQSSRKPYTDTIDRLDHSSLGGSYHHGGPYDAAIATRNRNPMYAPLEAVKSSNAEALKATPRDYVIDSMTRHVPLQGIAIIPPGIAHPRTGEVLEYEEGADLMREQDAPGGPYKRWEGMQYCDTDLKGKGEPSYTIEKQLKESSRFAKDRSYPPQAHSNANSSMYEMQPFADKSTRIRRTESVRSTVKKEQPTVTVRRRSNSATADTPSRNRSSGSHRIGHFREELSTPSPTLEYPKEEGALGSSNSRSGFSDGLKRRFGSLRKKH